MVEDIGHDDRMPRRLLSLGGSSEYD
jgi:hypothetical protein